MITVLFDTETDGLISNSLMDARKRPRILEIFAIKIEMIGSFDQGYEFVERETLNIMMNSGRVVPDEVTNITGIKTSDVAHLAGFDFFHKDILEFIEGAERVVAHNLTYDIAVVEFECERFALRKPDWPEKVCTVEATEHLKGHRLKLIDLYEYLFGERFEGAHRAETDVRAMTKCYIELIKRGEM